MHVKMLLWHICRCCVLILSMPWDHDLSPFSLWWSSGQRSKMRLQWQRGKPGLAPTDCKEWPAEEVKGRQIFFLGKEKGFFLQKFCHWCNSCDKHKSLSSRHFSHHGFLPPCLFEVSLPWKEKCYWRGLVDSFMMFWCKIWAWTGYLLRLKM